jgi:1-aminocyclopropane-1-carboxylate deaminase/D-cysteine desulfhydrase-like pyridoxal-dependent ACC family enzyme
MTRDNYRPYIQQLITAETEARGISQYISREDLNDPFVQGNKYHKLKLNIAAACKEGYETILTFGGAFSNHIYATAMAGRRQGLKTIGVIRGEARETLNPTLRAAVNAGMTLYYVDREAYREKYSEEMTDRLANEFGPFYMLPEGGTNDLAIEGCRDMVSALPLHFDFITLSAGTGGTAAGVISGLRPKEDYQTHVIIFSSLKGDFLKGEVSHLLSDKEVAPNVTWEVDTHYHFGGYAKVKPELASFIKAFRLAHAIQLEPVYTGKMFYGLTEMIRKGRFEPDTRILGIHTGGLQGLEGMRDRYGDVF